MRTASSSTSNSEPGGGAGAAGGPGSPPRAGGFREAFAVAAWTLAFLAAADVAVNRLFPLPRDPRVEAKGKLHTYFNYGWSIEAKIRRQVGPTDADGAPLMLAGWIAAKPDPGPREPQGPPGDLPVSVYGMSFSNQVANAMAQLDRDVRLRLFAGPAAPANHSYAAYSIDRGGPSKVVVLAVLGSSVQGLATNNGMTWRFEGPAPFTYPRYVATASGLEAEWPSVRTLDDLRACLASPASWDAYVSQLRSTDLFSNGFLFRHDATDHSALMRMIRRAVAQRWQSSRSAQIHGPAGFAEGSPAVASLRAILADFAANARRDGKLPVVLLVEDRGYRDDLSRAVGPVLARDRIPHLGTHSICPDSDPRNFAPDGHFTPEANRKIARRLLDLIRRELRDDKP